MSFYDYGQTVGKGSLGNLIQGGEEGFTFAQGVKSMLQKRKEDAQKSGDEHDESGIKQAIDMKTAGIQHGPSDLGVTPNTDPTNAPRQADGAMEVGSTTPLPTGITNPQPQPGLWGRIGHALSGVIHTNTGQNTAVHTTDAFTDRPGEAGKQLSERVSDIAQSGENSRLATTEQGLNDRNIYTQGHEDQRNFATAQAGIEEARIRAGAERANRLSMSGGANTEREFATLQRALGNLNSVQHGFMGGMAQAKDSPEWMQTEHQKAAIRRRMEQITHMKPGELEGLQGETQQTTLPGQPQGQTPAAHGGDMYEGFDPSLFGGPNGLPPVTDATYKQYLISIGKGPRQ